MAVPTPFTNMDPVTAADARSKGLDPHELDRCMEQLLTYICTELLPDLPVSEIGELTALPASDGVDRISRLPDLLLRNIVSRLPVTDAALTAVLASRWRHIWLSAPAVLVDAYLRPDDFGWPPTPANSPAITATVSRILDAHPGPFRTVHLVCSHMSAYQAQLARWLELLAAKGVHELVLVNRPWPREVPLPATLFSISTLTSLYIGLWKFPDTARFPPGASFPYLRELGICSVVMENRDVEVLVARSPVLEILSIQGSMEGLRLRLVSQSLRCVQICGSVVESIVVVKTPRLERLILEGSRNTAGGLCTRVKIGDAPKLRAFGTLEPGNHALDIQDTIIMAGIKASASARVTSVTILSLSVRFRNCNDAKTLQTFLRCFPNVERLHIKSGKCDRPTGRLNLKFWELASPIESVKSRIKSISFREFRGEQGEVAFLKFFFRSAQVLKNAVIVMANPRFTPFSKDDAFCRLKKASAKMASKSCQIMFLGSNGPEGGKAWSFQRGTDFSLEDPFSAVEFLS